VPPWSIVGSELSLAAVTAAAVLGLSRLYSDASFLPPVLVAVALSHGLAAWARRARFNTAVSLVISALGLAAVAIWVIEVHTTTVGIPGAGTWHGLSADLREAWQRFGDVVAPTAVTRGFVLASAAGAWVAAYLGDVFAFRLRTRFEALVPSFTVFLFGAVLGSDRNRLVSAGAYLAAVLLFVAFSDVATRSERAPWFGDHSRRAETAMVAGALTVGLVSLMAALTVGPLLPRAESPGLVGWRDRQRDSKSRVTVSPLVDIRSRLVDQSATEVFTVSAASPTYWRLTALDRFDGTIWSSEASYRSARSGSLPSDPAQNRQPTETTLSQEFQIGALASVWLPAAYRPERVEGAGGARFDPEGASLLTDKATSDSLHYRVVSALPRLTAAELGSQAGSPPKDIAERYLALPPDLPQVATRLARDVVGPEPTTPYQKAKALQDWFRSQFTYSTDIPAGHGEDAIVRFLRIRRGYCEQFAGTYAAMARSLGLPARVAVGFTPGTRDTQGLFHVAGKDAHAWPEVFIGDYGWVPFEPTPGRGLPGAEDYTRVPAPDATSPEATTTTVTPTTTAGAQGTATTTAGAPATAPAPGSARAHSQGPGKLALALILVALAVAAYVVGVPAARRWQAARRRAAAHTPTDRVLVAWREAEESLAAVGARRRPPETLKEYSARVERGPGEPPPGLGLLATDTTAAAYSADGVDEEIAVRAEKITTGVAVHVRAGTGWVKRVRQELDPRPLVPSHWRRAHWRRAR